MVPGTERARVLAQNLQPGGFATWNDQPVVGPAQTGIPMTKDWF